MKEFKKLYLFDLQTGKKINTIEQLKIIVKNESKRYACSAYLDTNVISRFKDYYNNPSSTDILSEFNRIKKIKDLDLIGMGASLEYSFDKMNMSYNYERFSDIENTFNEYINNGYDGYLPFKNKSIYEDQKRIESFKNFSDDNLNITYVLFLKIIDIDRKEITFIEKVKSFILFMNNELKCLSSYELIIACDIFCEKSESNFKKIIKQYNKIKRGELKEEDIKRELINASWDIFHLRIAEQIYLNAKPDIKNENKEPYIIFATLDKEFSNLINSRINVINILNQHNLIEFNKLNKCMEKDFEEIHKFQIQEYINNEHNRKNNYSEELKINLEDKVFNFNMRL